MVIVNENREKIQLYQTRQAEKNYSGTSQGFNRGIRGNSYSRKVMFLSIPPTVQISFPTRKQRKMGDRKKSYSE